MWKKVFWGVSLYWREIRGLGERTEGIVSKLVTKGLNPSDLSVSVRYAPTGPCGIKAIKPMAYIGHRSYSVMVFHRPRRVMASRLCMSPLDGSSLKTRLTTMATSLSVNHPLGRNQVFVCTIDAGMLKKEAMPMLKVMRPSMRNSHRQPAHPLTPPRCRMAKARSEVVMVVIERVVQKKLLTVREGSE